MRACRTFLFARPTPRGLSPSLRPTYRRQFHRGRLLRGNLLPARLLVGRRDRSCRLLLLFLSSASVFFTPEIQKAKDKRLSGGQARTRDACFYRIVQYNTFFCFVIVVVLSVVRCLLLVVWDAPKNSRLFNLCPNLRT